MMAETCRVGVWEINECQKMFFFWWLCDPTRVMASSFLRFLYHTKRRNTVGRTPLDEWSARRWDLYLTTHDTHIKQTAMLPVGFEPTISAGERPQTYALDRAATGTGLWCCISRINNQVNKINTTVLFHSSPHILLNRCTIYISFFQN